MADMCGDNRFEIIEAAKKDLIEATNIETSPEEMAVLDDILFRMWQMDWLPIHAHWIEEEDCTAVTDIPWSMCSACGEYSLKLPYCAFCGAKMDEEVE